MLTAKSVSLSWSAPVPRAQSGSSGKGLCRMYRGRPLRSSRDTHLSTEPTEDGSIGSQLLPFLFWDHQKWPTCPSIHPTLFWNFPLCDGLNENGPHRLTYLNAWFLVGECLIRISCGLAGGSAFTEGGLGLSLALFLCFPISMLLSATSPASCLPVCHHAKTSTANLGKMTLHREKVGSLHPKVWLC